jgi:hypothetical protein
MDIIQKSDYKAFIKEIKENLPGSISGLKSRKF